LKHYPVLQLTQANNLCLVVLFVCLFKMLL